MAIELKKKKGARKTDKPSSFTFPSKYCFKIENSKFKGKTTKMPSLSQIFLWEFSKKQQNKKMMKNTLFFDLTQSLSRPSTD